WMVLASLKTSLQITNPQEILSSGFTLENYHRVFAEQNFLPFIVNSGIVGISSTLISLLLGAPAAYSIARTGMRRSAAIILLARIIPGVSLLVPWYFLFSRMGLVGGYGVLILSHMFISLPLIVWILISFFEGIPEELEESAQIDGLTPIGAFLRIVLPLSAPGLATSGILAFIFSWNNFLFALVLSAQETRTLPVAIYNFVAYASIDWGGLMAASVLITIPVTVIGLLFQRHIVSGLTAGATKG
ncbi:MAG: carbohydrate ABC transporter permease, partial [Propionicimonas sp.]|nr:carbohydrate ABC transporter permease [Propionicimonas sp.]